jgi:type IV secretion system protein VirB6
VLSGCLLLYVALIGYRMMLGQTHDARAAVLAAARAGLVIALASSWASYQPMVQALVLRGPPEIAAAVLRPSGLEPLTPAQAAKALRDDRPAELVTPAPGPPQAPGSAPRGAGELRPSTTTAWLALRLIAGILLGLGPLLIPLALFDTTLGLVEGWARGLMGVLLGSAAVLIITTLEFDFFKAEMARDAGADFASTAPVFGLVGWIAPAAMVGVACCFRFARFRLPQLALAPESRVSAAPEGRGGARLDSAMLSEQGRAQQVAQAMLVQVRRDQASDPPVSRTAHFNGSAFATAKERAEHADTLGTRRSITTRSRRVPSRLGKRS